MRCCRAQVEGVTTYARIEGEGLRQQVHHEAELALVVGRRLCQMTLVELEGIGTLANRVETVGP